MMKKNLFVFYFLILALAGQAQSIQGDFAGCRSMRNMDPVLDKLLPAAVSITDSLHVAHYEIHIDTIDIPAKIIRAYTLLTVVSKQNNISVIPLSLLQLNIDSVILPSGPASFTYNDTTIGITLPAALNQGDSITAVVYYNGNPKQDASGWGGFYFSGSYAFNLGVGFAADPHNLGKVWFPCLDEFTDRASYDFYITTGSTDKAFCNGMLVSETLNPNGTKTWHWQLAETIPTYLASVAVAPFYSLQRTSNGIPVVWACLPADTNNTLATFSNLDTILGAFIHAYGSYPFSKAGFVEIPFNSGAMEHATSIHIGKAFIDGTKNYETLWAHELSHMWWGDKVTCETAGDMWLNEGFASFNEALTRQVVGGQTAYKDWIRTNHRKVLQFAHTPAQDGAYYSMINIPGSITYGNTVYQKGADMVHTLRYYMGDSLFFNGCQFHLNAQAYGNSNSYQLRDNLSSSSGISMNRFFDDWIFSPGFPHFSIDSVVYVPGGLDHYFVYTRQKTKGNGNHIYAQPVEITFSNGFNPDTTVTILIDSATNMFHIPLIIGNATWVALDRNEKISDAISDYEKQITAAGLVNMPETNVTLNVINSGNNTSRIRVEHNWVTPDPFKGFNQGIRISDYHYWKIDGILDAAFHSKATFSYNGTANASTGYLDNTLLTAGTTEDSLVMLYRSYSGDDWKIVNGYTVNKGAQATDKIGNIVVDTLKKGEYVFGIYDHSVTGIQQIKSDSPFKLGVNPNPSSLECTVSFNLQNLRQATIQIIDTAGKIVRDTTIHSSQTSCSFQLNNLAAGTYQVRLITADKVLDHIPLILLR